MGFGIQTKEMISERLIQYAIRTDMEIPGCLMEITKGKWSEYWNSSEDDKLKIVNYIDWLEGGRCFDHAVDDETYKNWKAEQLKIKEENRLIEIENRLIETENRKTKIIKVIMILLTILLGEWVGRYFALYILIN